MKYVSAVFRNSFRLLDELDSITWIMSAAAQPWGHIWLMQPGRCRWPPSAHKPVLSEKCWKAWIIRPSTPRLLLRPYSSARGTGSRLSRVKEDSKAVRKLANSALVWGHVKELGGRGSQCMNSQPESKKEVTAPKTG